MCIRLCVIPCFRRANGGAPTLRRAWRGLCSESSCSAFALRFLMYPLAVGRKRPVFLRDDEAYHRVESIILFMRINSIHPCIRNTVRWNISQVTPGPGDPSKLSIASPACPSLSEKPVFFLRLHEGADRWMCDVAAEEGLVDKALVNTMISGMHWRTIFAY